MLHVRVAIALTFLWLLTSTGPLAAADRPVITITVSGDTVEYDQDQSTVAVRGNVTATAQTDRPGAPTVSLAAEQLEGDLRSGLVIAQQGVRLRSQQIALRGEAVRLNFRTDEFTLHNGAASVEMESEAFPGRVVRGFFFGDEISGKANLIYVINARITTCDREHPHYTIGARRLRYDDTTGVLTISRGQLQLYGLKLELPGTYSTRPGSGPSGGGLGLPVPAYSSYNGLYFPFYHSFLSEESDWKLTGALAIGTKLQFPGALILERATEEDNFRVAVTRREDVTWDLNRRSRISRLPEISYWRGFNPTLEGVARLQGTVFGGWISERAPGFERTSNSRVGVLLSYSGTPRQRQDRRGSWWATEVDQTFYDDGERLRDVRLEAGYGAQLTDRTRAALWGIHHFTSGSSPFLFDDVFVEDELLGSVSTWLGRRWGVDLYGRYDVDREELRDYSVKLSRRSHCLTWSLQYDRAGQSIGIGLDINGLTGNTEPADTQPLVAPEEVPPLPAMVPGAEPGEKPGLGLRGVF